MNHNPPWLIRPLRHADLPLFRLLRLTALRDHPEAYGSSFEEEQHSDLTHMIGESPNVTLGGFVDGTLAATAAMIVSPKLKSRHKGHIVGVYVTPAWRGTGLARAVLDHLISEARNNGLLILTLSVSVGNPTARRLYQNAGFVQYGTEPASLVIGGRLVDADLMALPLTTKQ